MPRNPPPPRHLRGLVGSTLVISMLLAVMTRPAALAGAPAVVVDGVGHEPVYRVLQVTGTVTSPRVAMLSPSVAGLVAVYEIDDGDVVDAGDVLIRLDVELGTLALAQARAARQEVSVALDDARRRLAEAERVGSERGIAESEIRALRAEVAMDEAALEVASAVVRQREVTLSRHDIVAPFAGVVSRRVAEIGEWVAPGDEVLELVATDGLRFDFPIPQEHFPRIDGVREIALQFGADPGETVPARVHRVVPVSDPAQRTFLLRAVVDGDDMPAVTPGMSVRAQVRIAAGRESVVAPRDALLRYPDGRTSVWVIEEGGNGETTVREHFVETGVAFDGRIEILTGLSPGDRVVTRGNESLQEGQPVSIR